MILHESSIGCHLRIRWRVIGSSAINKVPKFTIIDSYGSSFLILRRIFENKKVQRFYSRFLIASMHLQEFFWWCFTFDFSNTFSNDGIQINCRNKLTNGRACRWWTTPPSSNVTKIYNLRNTLFNGKFKRNISTLIIIWIWIDEQGRLRFQEIAIFQGEVSNHLFELLIFGNTSSQIMLEYRIHSCLYTINTIVVYLARYFTYSVQ